MNVWRKPGRRAAAAPAWRRVGDSVKRGGSPGRAAMVPVWPNPGGVLMEVGKERLVVTEWRRTGPAATPSPVGVHTAHRALSPPPSIHGRHNTVPLAQGSGEVLRQPEAEEEVRQGRAGGPQRKLQAHDEGSGGGHQP